MVDTSRQFVYGCASLWEVIEQIDLLNDDNVLLTHVFGLGIDDEVSYRIEDLATAEDFWTHRDDLGSVTSLTDSNGAVVERYEYGDYGDVRIFDAAGVALAASSYNIHHLYTGRSIIPGTGLMDYRFRVHSPETGRFVQRDPLGYIDGMNAYVYVSLNPLGYRDPLGLFGVQLWLDIFYVEVGPKTPHAPPTVIVNQFGAFDGGQVCNKGDIPIWVKEENGGWSLLLPGKCTNGDGVASGLISSVCGCKPGESYKVVDGCTLTINKGGGCSTSCPSIKSRIAQNVKGGCKPRKEFGKPPSPKTPYQVSGCP